MIPCVECGETSFHFDEHLGERVCDNCGLVIVSEPFEQEIRLYDEDGNAVRSIDKLVGSKAVNKYDRVMSSHVLRGLTLSRMCMASLTQSRSLIDRIENAYLSCFRAGVFGVSSYESRATALTFYLLRERNLPYTLAEVCEEFNSNKKEVSRLAKRIAKHFGNSRTTPLNYLGLVEKHAESIKDLAFSKSCGIVFAKIERLLEEREQTIKPNYVAGALYITSLLEFKRLTQKQIGEECGCSNRTVREMTKELLAMIGKTEKEIKGKGIQWLASL
jgi:transcription initiation factor TFIIIB Brf1 subunit/transcription initiation factor TFIIB